MEESGTPPAPPSLNAACRNLAVEIVRSTGNQDFPLMPHPRTVAFGVESDLREPVATWLCREGFDVRMEVPILGRRADLVGSRGTTVAAIEMKMHRWVEALRQAIAYQLGADLVWVAMPLADASRAYRQRWTFEAQGVGLLAVDDRGQVRGPIRAAASPRLLPFVREKLLETLRVHESPLVAPGDFPTLEGDEMAPSGLGKGVRRLPRFRLQARFSERLRALGGIPKRTERFRRGLAERRVPTCRTRT